MPRFAPVAAAFAAFAAFAAPARADERLEVWTMGASDEVFERFGHAAICLGNGGADGLEGTCWNYGTTDFTAPGRLVWDFLRHRAMFWASVASMRATYRTYARRDRTIYRQVIAIAPDQLARVKARLAHDQEPAHRLYLYHHFDDNCSTRVRDIVDEAVNGRLAAGKSTLYPRTLRSMVREGFASSRLLLAAAEILIGRTADRRPTTWDAMYHPDVLREESLRRLGAEPQILYARRAPLAAGDPTAGPLILALLGLLLAAAIAALGWSRARALVRGGRWLAGLALGAFGLALWGLALVAPQRELRQNELLAVLLPLDVAIGFLPERWLERYLVGRFALLAGVAVLTVAGLLVQPLLGPLLLVALPLGAVAAVQLRSRRRKVNVS